MGGHLELSLPSGAALDPPHETHAPNTPNPPPNRPQQNHTSTCPIIPISRAGRVGTPPVRGSVGEDYCRLQHLQTATFALYNYCTLQTPTPTSKPPTNTPTAAVRCVAVGRFAPSGLVGGVILAGDRVAGSEPVAGDPRGGSEPAGRVILAGDPRGVTMFTNIGG